MCDSKTKAEESTRLTYTGLLHSCIHWVVIHRYVSFTEVGNVYGVALREPIHLCTYVSEEGDDGEVACSETATLLSYILRYVSLTGKLRVQKRHL
jgi:hypothetical protein